MILPRGHKGDVLRDAFTGHSFHADPTEGIIELAVADLFADLPVALLELTPV